MVGHVLDKLAELPEESVHCVVTSPPYWGLRAYGTEPQVWGGDAACEHSWLPMERGKRKDMLPADQTASAGRSGGDHRQAGASHNGGNFCSRCGAWRGEHGQEPTLDLWLAHEVTIFRAVRRVLRKDGTLWVNIGDAYACAPNGRSAAATTEAFSTVTATYRPEGKPRHGNHSTLQGSQSPETPGRVSSGGIFKPKDRLGLPHRLAFALQADGWWFRDEIVWHKPNPMPSSVRDRTTPAHEFMFMFSKSARYYYDQEAIKEPSAASSLARYAQTTIHIQAGGAKQDAYEAGLTGQRARSRRPNEIIKDLAAQAKRKPAGWATADGAHDTIRHNAGERKPSAGGDYTWATANKRSVWTIPTQPFPSAHFATFPEALVAPCILAGTSARGVCGACGAPWARTTKTEALDTKQLKIKRNVGGREDGMVTWATAGGLPKQAEVTTGWVPSCKCTDNVPVPATVLDPFAGSGTVGLVAEQAGRDSILIELNPAYAEMARERIHGAIQTARITGLPDPTAAGGLFA